MDEFVDDVDELESNLRDIAFANAHLGGTAPVVRALRGLAAHSVLDVGSGLADIPLALAEDAVRRGVELRVTCLDRSEQMLALARRRCGEHRALTFVCAEGTDLPFASGSFDVVLCTLALHHFDREPARALLRELVGFACLPANPRERKASQISAIASKVCRGRCSICFGKIDFALRTFRLAALRHLVSFAESPVMGN